MLENIRRNLKIIFPLLVLLLIAGLILSRVYHPQPSIPEPSIIVSAKEANQNIGRAAKVCGRVASARYLREAEGRPTFINLGRPHPDQYFTAVIWGEHRSKWETRPEKQYHSKQICVIGTIRRHEDTPQIEVTDPRQIMIRDRDETEK